MAEPRIEVGRFALIDGNTVEGPGNYMADQGNALVDRILAGEDCIFNMTAHMSPSAEIAVLVRLQTDFAGWKGVRQFSMGVRPRGSRVH